MSTSPFEYGFVGNTSSMFTRFASTMSNNTLVNNATFQETVRNQSTSAMFVGLASLMSFWFGKNDILSAGFGIIILNACWGAIQSCAYWAIDFLKARVTYSVTVHSKDEAFTWLLEWFATQSYMKSAHSMMLKTARKSSDDEDDARPKLTCLPSVGHHLITYKGCYVSFNRSTDSSLSEGRGGSLSISSGEILTITLYHYDKNILTALIHEAMELSFSKLGDKTCIYGADSWDSDWAVIVKKDKRELTSVVLDETVAAALEKDLKFFLDNKEWYRTRGVPYRRGYLLHGPPGTGKTSFIFALAGKLGYNLCTLNIAGDGLDDRKLLSMLQQTPKKSFVVLEDVDAVFHKRKQAAGVKVTFSGLLNALDGIGSTDGRILFMTTNHVDRLSPALIRPGRVDRKFMFDYATSSQMRTMFVQFFELKGLEDILESIIDGLKEAKVTTAQLQGWFIMHSSEPEQLPTTMAEFISEVTKDNNRTDELQEEAEEEKKDEKKEEEKTD